MKNSEKIMEALKQAYPGATIKTIADMPWAAERIYIDDRYVGKFDLSFWDTEVYRPTIEIKVKAPLYNIKDFLEEVECNGIFYHAVERGLKEWEEGSQANN